MPKCDFNKVALTLLKSHFGMGVLLSICCIFSENLFLRTPLDGCFDRRCLTGSSIRLCKVVQRKIYTRKEFRVHNSLSSFAA